ncbi:hypothetical protein MNBD_GAMMA22-136 [hydrothermal vent metagenome]|uniref:EF-hand domain-containing protein n=1 Tax=hydrothermal vent metagenome TaxID=652676 RepID=A0A3B1AK27_9ZZZZ
MTSKISLKPVLFISFIVSLLILSSIASANDRAKFFKLYDTNNDKKVTRSEFKMAAQMRFTSIDENKDDIIDKLEFINWRIDSRDPNKRYRLGKIDINADGEISEAEFLHSRNRGTKRRFDRLDINRDGVLSLQELRRNPKVKYFTDKNNNKRFKKFDLNNDQKISQDEIISRWSKLFNRLDRNNDEVVTLKEFNRANKKASM